MIACLCKRRRLRSDLLSSYPLSSRNTDPQAHSRQPEILERDWTFMNTETDAFLEASKDRVPS